MLTTLAVSHYRSLHDLCLPLDTLNVISGANGSGKSNAYRALRLIAEAAQGGLVPALAREGGFGAALWAGPDKLSPAMRRGEAPIQGSQSHGPRSLKLGFASDDFGYAIDLGAPTPSPTRFTLDPHIKRECIWAGGTLRDATLLIDRRNALARSRSGRAWRTLTQHLAPYDSVFNHCADPIAAPELLQLRERMRGWRFYDHLRTDALAPARQPQVGTHTPALANDGGDLAAAWQTILEIGDAAALQRAVDDAFPGAVVDIDAQNGRFSLLMRQHGLLRPLAASELSDGTLRYLLLIAALLSPRPPELLVLNEPEASLHPDLFPALARLITAASGRAQVIVVSHAVRLVSALEQAGAHSLALEKTLGQTQVLGQEPLTRPAWHWPTR
ncbi:AAA family ATPase [Paludibacterium sp.]|uniref:AAA family ATPase n=1 Tax=Paludibacterium sp. TaxID=1917523 RepID=UPI0025E8DAB8|nr:AAA family ATPase [Paludibacterium sp.]MBV8648616.1 AAA family ATPase [Paludibacterium sp.]